MKKLYFFIIGLLSLFLITCSSQQVQKEGLTLTVLEESQSQNTSWLDTVKAGAFDNGKMWTFDFPPTEFFKTTYSFAPDDSWYEKARLSSIRLPGCSASFVSEDGLILTNHHCVRGSLDRINKSGENIPEDGFYAKTLEEERKVQGVYVDQLVNIQDVTKAVQAAFDSGKTDEEKVKNRAEKIIEIEKSESEKTGYTCQVVTFYNGGRYSLYSFKRYTDIRMVFAVETQIGFFGGDIDNFTYPRYNLDFSFYRAYDDNGKPLKPSHYFKFSETGVKEDDVIFVIGNPGRTNRLRTVSQLEFFRDHSYNLTLAMLSGLVDLYTDIIAKHPERKMELQTQLFGFANSQKVYNGALEALKDPVVMAKKKDFEKSFKAAVMADPKLKAQYATLWDDIDSYQKERSKFFGLLNGFSFRGPGRSTILGTSFEIAEYGIQLQKPEKDRKPAYKGTSLDSVKNAIMAVNVKDKETILGNLTLNLSLIKLLMGEDPSAKLFLGNKNEKDLANQLIESSVAVDDKKVKDLLNNPQNILSSKDPAIVFMVANYDKVIEARDKSIVIQNQESSKMQLLGKALYDVYGTKMPPDATFSLRIADGVVKGYEYNGTIAPPITTFYGMYDRFYSFSKEFPWSLPEKWHNPPASLNMNTPVNFVASADIIGGNSGSPLINKNQEVVGLAFDGNIESLQADFIFNGEINKTVAVHSAGIIHSLEHIYKADRIVKELRTGKIPK
jgi:V8-like Glu-specific endopeptidase